MKCVRAFDYYYFTQFNRAVWQRLDRSRRPLVNFDFCRGPRRSLANQNSRKTMIQRILLWVFHLFLALKRFFAALLTRPRPQPLRATRRKVPAHLAVTLSELRDPNKYPDDLRDALESVRRLVDWCRAIGIRTLSVFDKEGQC
jgi:hypothetical protein